ncbi:MAG TPA: sensor histidine kinase [Spongiibacteraceae bacterium]|nr:sensor histidine kinase [Spongiibacteraceae bacterium]
MPAPREQQGTTTRGGFFIPDLCSVQAVFFLVLVAELLALVLAVGGAGLRHFSWQQFATISLFVQWTVLLSAGMLCRLRVVLARWPPERVAAVGYAAVLGITAALSIAAQWLMGALLGGGNWRLDYWSLLDNMLICAVLAGIALRYLYLTQQLRQRQRAELEARLDALQARIRPHFLFNSMNSIASLIGSDPLAAEAAVEDLASLFRATISQTSVEVTVAEELDLCRRYLRIEQLRLGARLQIEWRVEALPATLPIPNLSLQPLVENAIYHGIQELPEGGTVYIDAEYKEGWVRIAVSNPLPGGAGHHKGNRMALDNIAHRLQALYGDDAGVRHEQRAGATPRDSQFITRLYYRVAADRTVGAA